MVAEGLHPIRTWLGQIKLEFINGWTSFLLPLLKVLFLFLLGYFAWLIFKLLSRKVANYLLQFKSDQDHEKRARTLISLFNNLGIAIIGSFVFAESLAEFGYSIAPLVATAGVAGFALAFGMQNIIKDISSGFLLLFDGQIREGDIVEVAGKTGLVEKIRLRFIQVRDAEGFIHYLPNGSIGIVSNHTKEYCYIVLDLDIDAQASYEEVEFCVKKIGIKINSDPRYSPYILEDLEILGIEKLDGNSMTFRFRMRVRAHEAATIRRAFLLELKRQLDIQGIPLAKLPT